MVICLVLGADLHMTQLMPLPLTVSCFSKIQIGFTFLVLADPRSPGQRAVKPVCVCVCVFIFKHTGDRLWWVTTCWQHGIVVSGVWYMNEVTLRRAWLVLGWVTLFGLCSLSWYLTISVCNQPTRSTQPASLRVANSSTSFGCGKGSTTLGDPNCCALYLYLLPFTCVFHWTVMGQINLTVFFWQLYNPSKTVSCNTLCKYKWLY